MLECIRLSDTLHTCAAKSVSCTRWVGGITFMTRLSPICGMNYWYTWHDFFICGTWLIHMCGLTHSYVWLDSLRRGTWHIHMCGTTHPYVWYDIVSYMGHDSFIRVPWLPNLHGLRQRARWRARPYRYHMGFHIRHMGWVLGMWYPMWYLYAYWFCMPIAVDARAQVCRVWEYIHKDTHNTMQ